MFAGDVSKATALYNKIDKDRFSKTDDIKSIVNACRRAYWELNSEDATAHVLGPLNLTLDEFLDDGVSKFPESVFDRLVADIQNYQIARETDEPCLLLTAGFEAPENAHIFSISSASEVHHAGRIGFAAIGSGAPSALADLYFHEYNSMLPLEEAMYRVLSAKFMSERASGVGQSTLVMLMRHGTPALIPDGDQIEAIRDMWDQEGCARLPEHYRERVKEILRTSFSP